MGSCGVGTNQTLTRILTRAFCCSVGIIMNLKQLLSILKLSYYLWLTRYTEKEQGDVSSGTQIFVSSLLQIVVLFQQFLV